jgi:Calcineurin-like phosphoesterase
MDLESVIVGHTQIQRAIGGAQHESVLRETETEFVDAANGDQVRAAKMMIAFSGALKSLQKAETSPSVLSSPQHQFGALLQSRIAELAMETGKLQPLPPGLGLEVRFDEKDWLGWAGSFFTWAEKIFRGKFDLPPVQAIQTIPNEFSMALLADWGTGLYGAPECAKSIAKVQFEILLHLGDVYYAGMAAEEKSRFLKYWPTMNAARSYALNSNHEMYTGGHGYMEVLLGDDRFKKWQTSNYFALQNDNFLLVGLDTAYEEHSLIAPEVTWLNHLIQNAGGKKVVLFSHHQPFSIFDSDNAAGEGLLSLVASLLAQKKLFAWYWGHEHRCIIYDKHPNFALYGRCLGHGGFPQFRSQNPGISDPCPAKSTLIKLTGHGGPDALFLDGPNSYIKGQETDYTPNGYLTLSFAGAKIHERVCDPDGTILWENDLQ